MVFYWFLDGHRSSSAHATSDTIIQVNPVPRQVAASQIDLSIPLKAGTNSRTAIFANSPAAGRSANNKTSSESLTVALTVALMVVLTRPQPIQ
jgi:hypothetical protein